MIHITFLNAEVTHMIETFPHGAQEFEYAA